MDQTTSSFRPETCPEYPKIETLFRRDDKFKAVEGELRHPEFAIPGRWLVTEKVDGTNICASLEQSDEPHDHGNATGSACTPDDLACNYYALHRAWQVHFYGRTAKAQIPAFLLEHLQGAITLEKMKRLWRGRNSCRLCEGSGWLPVLDPDNLADAHAGDVRCECVEPYPIALYGEGYGARIQKGGGNYRSDSVSFRLFDVLVGSKWLNWDAVKDIAERVGIETVPAFCSECTEEIIKATSGTFLDAVVALVRPPGFESRVALEDGGTGCQAEGIVARTDPYLYDWRGKPLRFKLKTSDFSGS